MKNATWLIVMALLGAVVIVSAALYRARHIAKPPPPPDGPTITLDLGGGVLLELVRIEPGEFEMGSDDSEAGHDVSESPRHKVRISRPFYIGKYEITQGQYQAVMNYNAAQFRGDPSQAVDSVAWSDAQKFCKYACERTGRAMRLPTEAEWEYACRAGTTTPYSFGNELLSSQAVFNWSKVNESDGKPASPAAAGSKKSNAWGLYDMHGNLWEWCEDAFVGDYNKHPATQGAVLPSGNDPSFVYRGGSWRSAPDECRSAVRFAGPADLRSDVMGFRVVVEPR